MDEKATALYFFRKLVYVLYLEVGALQPKIHPQLADKADMKNAFFTRDKEKQAAALYRLTENEESPAAIVAPYVERTRLTLEDIERAFREGNWRNKYNGYTFGGPRWVVISQAALQLRSLIDQGDWEKTVDLIYEIKKMKTNQAYLVSHFERGERRR